MLEAATYGDFGSTCMPPRKLAPVILDFAVKMDL
jgi:hypothetical protein